jgi:hypothetical protein
MKNKTRIQKLMTVVALALSVMIATADDGKGKDGSNAAEVRVRAKLAGPAILGRTPEGSADFRSQNAQTRLSVEVENVNMAAGTKLTVAVVHGVVSTTVGTITLSSTGFGELELESQNGAMVPAVVAGDMVTVSSGATTILAGVFGSV